MTEDLWEIRDKFSKLGDALGLQPGDVEAIRRTRMGDVDDCFGDVIKKCIDQGLYQGDIIEALESTKLRCIPLAARLRKKYKVYL